MFIRYIDKPELVKARMLFNCDGCLSDYVRAKCSYNRMKQNPLYDKDYCLSCWRKILNNIPETKQKQEQTRGINFDTSLEAHIIRSNRQKKIWENKDLREKISQKIINFYKDPKARQKISQGVKKAYEDKPELKAKQSKSRLQYYQEHPEAKIIMSKKLKELYQCTDMRKKVSDGVRMSRIKDPTIISRISKTSKLRGINKGDKNGMKKAEARKKVSETRKKILKNSGLRELYSQKTKAAWAAGKFDGVAVGRCKWYQYSHSNGKVYRVQGTWELAFIKWLDKNNLSFKCHKDWIPYILNGIKKNWYPDFWVSEWDSYVDVKCKYFYSKEKFDAIQKFNPDLNIKVLFQKDLISLGVEI